MSQAQTAKQALERAAKDKTRVRIFYGDPVTGKDDCDETRRSGKVLKTQAGAFVLLTDTRHAGRQGIWAHTIDTARVVRIAKYTRRVCKPVELYRHPTYTAGEWSSYYRPDLGRWIAIRNGLIHATFSNEMDAAIYVDYIVGNRAHNHSPSKLISFETLLKRTSKP